MRAFEEDENGEAPKSEETEPLFVRFDRREGEEKLWTVRPFLDWRVVEYGPAFQYAGGHIGLADGRLFRAGTKSLVSIDADSGDVLWVVTVPENINLEYPPVLAAGEDVLLVRTSVKGTDGVTILAFDTGTGKLLWETTAGTRYTQHEIISTPGLLLYLGYVDLLRPNAPYEIRALDPGSGSVRMDPRV